MKKIITLSFVLCGLVGFSQTTTETEETKAGYDKWSIDIGAGVSKPVRPMSAGAFTNTPSLFQADLGVRYMVNEKFGFNADFGYNNFTADENSLDFDSRYMRVTLEGVVNAGHIVGLNKLHERLGLLVHGGMGVSNLRGTAPVETSEDWMLNFQVGITPQIRISNSIAVFGDLSVLGHVRQDLAFDGLGRGNTRGFDGMLVNASVGLSIYLGENDTHADWYVNDVEDQIEDVVSKMDKMAKEYADDDKDGIPNYIDRDNTTESGVRVDNKGRALDVNKNGIPDDMESALDGRYASKSDMTNMTQNNSTGASESGIIKKLINEGYVNVYFQFNSTKPALYSLESINTLVTYMRDNPTATATLTGFADELGSPEYNKTLSERRAKMVNDVLIASGVDASRLSHNGSGEDASVDKSSSEARQLVRRVTFKVN